MAPTPQEVRDAVAEHGSLRKAATALGYKSENSLRQILRRQEAGVGTTGTAALDVNHEAGTATATLPSGFDASTVADLMRENGLDPADWIIVSTTINKWDGPVAGGGTQPLRQVKATLRLKPHLLTDLFPAPANHIPALVRPKRARRSSAKPRHYIVEGDHQTPYFDPQLDGAATALVADVQPDRHVFLGDGLDFPTISRHDDHPAQMASPQECLDVYYGILRRRAEAAPNARREKLKGNHDWRIESELLKRAERMYGIRPVGEDVPALSLRRLLHFDALGIELVEHPLGWDHAEVELVEGVGGLIVRHGWLTGANTAGRSLDKRGRSLIVGHNHSREHVYKWDPSARVERQAAVCGVMCDVRSDRFPVYAATDDSLQGLIVVTHWPGEGFQIEHARYVDGALYWRDRRYRA